jgi:epoxyqueuosine reductase QueG
MRKDTMKLGQWIEAEIVRFVDTSADNSLGMPEPEKAWDTPLVGFSRGDDDLYAFFKQDIGTFYWQPQEIFALHHPHMAVAAAALTVVSWVLPQTAPTRRDHRREKEFPAERWARSRLYGEQFNVRLRQFVADTLTAAGHASVAPMLSPHWSRQTSDRYGFASNWSERHTAFVCGLGTFGLSDGLITSRGKAVRFGSVVAHIEIEPTERPYGNHNAYCLFYQDKNCQQCAKRCPAQAISEAGHDKVKCRHYVRKVARAYAEQHFGLETNGCGLCQTGVPCEFKIPRSGKPQADSPQAS